MAFWELSGESGKSLGTTRVSLESLGIPNASVRMGSLEVDTVKFAQVFDDYSDVAAADIEMGQIVELWRDGVRFFKGHCTGRRARDTVTGGLNLDTTISGVWWWMAQTPLSGDINDQTGDSKERISFSFQTGNLMAHIEALIARAIVLGVPIALGTVSDCFEIPQITIKQMSLADAMAELMRWIPDATAWIDYSGAVPSFNVTRRDDATVTALTVGSEPCQSIDVNPIYELQLDQVVVTYVKRAVDGKTVYAEQISGHAGTALGGASGYITLAADASASDDAYNGLEVTIESGTGSGQTRMISDFTGSNKRAAISVAWTTNPDASSVYKIGNGNAATGKRQIVTVSGPELDSFLPNDLFDSFEASTVNATLVSGDMLAYTVVRQFEGDAVSIFQQGFTEVMLPIDTLQRWGSSPGATGKFEYDPRPPYMYRENGTKFSSGGYYVLKSEPPQWLLNDSRFNVIRVTCAGDYLYQKTTDFSADEDLIGKFGMTFLGFGYHSTTGANYQEVYHKRISFTAYLVDSALAGTIYREADYVFIAPPDGLAGALQHTQDFQPYEGEVGISAEEIGSTEYRNKVINLNSSLAAHSSMKALVQGYDLDTAAGSGTIRLGTPARLSYQGLVNRFRRTASDNIVYV